MFTSCLCFPTRNVKLVGINKLAKGSVDIIRLMGHRSSVLNIKLGKHTEKSKVFMNMEKLTQ